MVNIEALETVHFSDVLRINASADGAVFQLDQRELSRLTAISSAHRVAVGADGFIQGYLLAFFRDDPYDGEEFLALRSSIGQPFVYIDQVAVERRFRRAGTGRRLYEELASRGRNDGARVLCCEVNIVPPNPDSLAFHRRMGFRELGQLSTSDGRTAALVAAIRP